MIQPLILVEKEGGRPRTTDMREVMNAIFYLIRNGCQWDYLPKCFPPKSTVYDYFSQWRDEGILDDMVRVLREEIRMAAGRLGDYQNSRISLNDSRMIADLFQEKILGKFQLLEKMRQLADVDAIALQNDLAQAIKQHPKKIVVLTHVPPLYYRPAIREIIKVYRVRCQSSQ